MLIGSSDLAPANTLTTKAFQCVLVAFQLLVLGWYTFAAFAHVANGTAFDATAISPN